MRYLKEGAEISALLFQLCNKFFEVGAKHVRSDYPQNDNRYDYNGKEEQTTGGLKYLDYGARMYDNALGRWFNVDPLSEEYYGYSLYNYCTNNPIIFVDPNGEKGVLFFLVEGRVQVPFKRLGVGRGVALSTGVGFMIDFDSGKLTSMSSINIGGGVGAYLGAGVAFGWYPNAEIEELTGFGYNLGYTNSLKAYSVGAELNFTADLSAEGLADFWDKMRVGGNGTGFGIGAGAAAYAELGYIFEGKTLDFKTATVGDILNLFQGIGMEINQQQTWEMMIILHDMWYNRMNP